MAQPREESRAERASREIAQLPDLTSEAGLQEIGLQLDGYMAETLVFLIRRLGSDKTSKRLRRRAEFLLLDSALEHPDGVRLERLLQAFAEKLGPEARKQERFRDIFTDLFRKQLQSLADAHNRWEQHFFQRARSRALDALRITIREGRHEVATRPLEDVDFTERAEHPDPEDELLRGLAGTPVLDAALNGLTLRQKEALELWLEGHALSGNDGPGLSIQTLLGLRTKQAVNDRVTKALRNVRKNPQVIRLLEAQGRPLPPAGDPTSLDGDQS